ncbi:hypothetical protein D4R20_03205 [bacterium]|nr:MAG: hypothetical protein D4R20_03205 [bacterium]
MIAKTEQEKEECIDYLRSKGQNPIANIYVYKRKDGRICSCAGIIFVGLIEPFASDGLTGLQTFGEAEGFIESQCMFLGAMTTKDEVKSILEKQNYQLWSKETDIYIKGV